MKIKGPFLKAFVIAIPFFIFHLVPVLSTAKTYSSYDAGYVTGQVMANHVIAAIITGLLGKFAYKNSSWLKTTLIYFAVVMPIILLQQLGNS
ncbi:MAG: hypothetical protein F6K11_11875 [Leptolyngbya sp. SIO3F4]|nr:hypothetical protein [Leptolyngbya sp. SIO3F4]